MSRWLIIGPAVALVLVLAIVVFGGSDQPESDGSFSVAGEGEYDQFVPLPGNAACNYHNAVFALELPETLPSSDRPNFPLRLTLGALKAPNPTLQRHRVVDGVAVVDDNQALVSEHTIPISDYWDVPIDYLPVAHEGALGYWVKVEYAGTAGAHFNWQLSFEPIRPSDQAACP